MPDPFALPLGGQRIVVAERAARVSGREIVIPSLRGHPDVPKFGPWDKEFDVQMPPGYTITNAPTAWDANKTVPGHLYVKVPASNVRGLITWPSPPAPFTVIAKCAGLSWYPAAANQSQQPGLVLSTATPSAGSTVPVGVLTLGDGTANVRPQVVGTSLASSPAYALAAPIYYKLQVVSNSSVNAYFSFDGRLWTLIGNVNPGFTVGSMGFQGYITGANPASGIELAWAWLRVWVP